jgi:Zn-dependent M28 family amino/carboxypeptidase
MTSSRKCLSLVLLMAATASCALAQSIDPARLSDHIKVLSSDAFEGRGPGTPGETKTVAYIAGQFKAVGLTPAGDNGGWTQAVTLRSFHPVGEIKTSFTIAGHVQPLKWLDEIVVRTMLPIPHVSIKDAPMVFVGYGVSAPERHWDDFKGVDLKGKIAVVLVNDPDFELKPGDALFGRFDGKAETYYGRWTYKYEEMARRGAAGVLIVHETAPAAYGWATVRNSNSNPQFDVVRDDPAMAHTLVEGWIQRDVAVALFKAAGLDFDAEKARARTEGFTPVALKGATFSADYDVESETVVTHNVIGKLVGTTYPNEAVLYGAHWDHLGIGPPDATGDTIYHGALDNASGVAGLIELGRRFAQAPRTQRSVYFLAFTSEEKNLLGAGYYAAHPVVPLGTTVALLNMDILNLDAPSRDISDRGTGDMPLEKLFAAEGAKLGRTYSPDPQPQEGSFFRADHFALAQAGVPAITILEGQDFLVGGRAAGMAAHKAYFTQHYHQPSDKWRPDFNYEGAVRDLDVYYDLGRDLADSREWPCWEANSQFKPARDATAAERR